MTHTVRSLNACGLLVDISSALHWIAEAIQRGYDKGSMRWLVSPQQLRSMQAQLLAVSDAPQLRYISEHGFPDIIMFAGIPVAVSETLGPNDIVLQEIVAGKNISAISGLSVTAEDYRSAV